MSDEGRKEMNKAVAVICFAIVLIVQSIKSCV